MRWGRTVCQLSPIPAYERELPATYSPNWLRSRLVDEAQPIMDEISRRARERGIATKSPAWSASRQSARKRLGTYFDIVISNY